MISAQTGKEVINKMGRPKGAKNKLTNLKEVFLAAFNELENNADTKLVKWAKNNPTDFYKLVAKLLPRTLEGNLGLDVKTHEPILIIRAKEDSQNEVK